MTDANLPIKAKLEAATLTAKQREQAVARYTLLNRHLTGGATLTEVAQDAGVSLRTVQRWLADYRRAGLAGLARRPRSDRGRRTLPDQQITLIKLLAAQRPPLSAARIHRRVVRIAADRGWPEPSYSTVYAIMAELTSEQREQEAGA